MSRVPFASVLVLSLGLLGGMPVGADAQVPGPNQANGVARPYNRFGIQRFNNAYYNYYPTPSSQYSAPSSSSPASLHHSLSGRYNAFGSNNLPAVNGSNQMFFGNAVVPPTNGSNQMFFGNGTAPLPQQPQFRPFAGAPRSLPR